MHLFSIKQWELNVIPISVCNPPVGFSLCFCLLVKRQKVETKGLDFEIGF
jgi:hypothetical protein